MSAISLIRLRGLSFADFCALKDGQGEGSIFQAGG